MTKRTVIGFMLSILTTQAHAATATCPDLSGTWKGSCELGASTVPAAMQSALPLMVNQKEVLVISQPPAPLHCGLVQTGDKTILVGGLQDFGMSMRLNDGTPIHVSAISGAQWHASKPSLKSQAAGMVQVGDSLQITFVGQSRYELVTPNNLEVESSIKGDGFEIAATCTYTRQP